MQLTKTASKTLFKINKAEWLAIGKMAKWLTYWCPYCGKSFAPKNIDPQKIVREIQDKNGRNIPVFKAEHLPLEDTKEYPSHGVCPECFEKEMANLRDQGLIKPQNEPRKKIISLM